MDHYWTISEVAEYLRLSVETLYKYVQRGMIPAAKVGRHWRFDKEAIDRWMAAQAQTGASAEAVGSPRATSSVKATPLKVLVVDDDAPIRHLLQSWIKADGNEVDLAKDGAEAMERLIHQRYDLVFLDLQMPSLTGGQVLERLQEYDYRPPVVLITAFGETPLMTQAQQYDLLYVLSKPFEKRQVMTLLRSVRATLADRPAIEAENANIFLNQEEQAF